MSNENPTGVACGVIFVKAFESRCGIDRVTHHCEFEAFATPDATCYGRTAKNANAHLHWRSSNFLPVVIKSAKFSAHVERATHRIGGILLNIGLGSKRGGEAEHRHDRVAHVFIDESAVVLNVSCERLHIVVNPFHYLGRLKVL